MAIGRAPGLQPADGAPSCKPCGVVVLASDGSFTYDPTLNYVGGDSFTYKPHDGFTYGTLTTVTLTVVRPEADIDVDTNNDGPITEADDPVADPAFEEQDPGKIIPYNGDDDNGNSQPDRDDDPGPFQTPQGGILDDDELLLGEGRLNVAAIGAVDLTGYKIKLIAGPGVKVWESADKAVKATGPTYIYPNYPHTVYIEGIDPGAADVEMVLKNPTGVEVHRDKVRLTVVKIESVDYVQQGTTGLPSHNNPDGTGAPGGQPAFKGGWRFFPDANDFGDRDRPLDESYNVVRVQAQINPAIADVNVTFRPYDVDDPSVSTYIDVNGDPGGDNRGTFADFQFVRPGPSTANGYHGRLRPVGVQEWGAEGAPLTVQTDAQGIAEVELLTTFAPGDNFRVAAAINPASVMALANVPTKGDVITFPGTIAEQLSVWRRFHIEQDVMEHTDSADLFIGRVTDPGTVVGGHVIVKVHPLISTIDADQLEGGILRVRTAAPYRNYDVIGNTAGGPATDVEVTIVSTAPLQMNDLVTMYEDDFIATRQTRLRGSQ